MQKKFLDKLYAVRGAILKDIAIYDKKSKDPIAQCCDKMEAINLNAELANAKRVELASIDAIIEAYIYVYTKP